VVSDHVVTVGLSVYDITAPDLLDLARAADEAGFDAIWLGEHLLLPVGYASEHPTSGSNSHEHIKGPIVSPDTELVDPLVALGAVAGATTRLRLATGIYILPLRHPIVTARAVATLQEASAGRFMLGIGAGWLEEEFTSLDVPFKERRTRLVESIEVMRAAWAGGPFEHHGTHFSMDRIQVSRRRVDVPLIMGGNTPKALRRAVELGDGWFSSGTPDFDDAVRLFNEIRGLRSEVGLDGEYRCYFRVASGDPALREQYGAEGIDDVVVWADQLWPAKGSVEEKREAFFAAAAELQLVDR
jgi:probable F420-dependent oxidoreductase